MWKIKKRKVVGVLDEKGFEQDNRVYFRGGCCPELRAANSTVNVLRKQDEVKKSKCNRSNG